MAGFVDQIVGRYRLDALIGAGGMAEVYRGSHIELGRVAAIKVLWQNFAADPTFQEEFLREARAAASLSHPNIVSIYDFGRRDGDGLLYLAMELMAKGSLRDVLARQPSGTPLDLASGLNLVRQAADGLGYAHRAGIVHRDVKPENLLLGPATGHGPGAGLYTVKVGDFGLAEAIAARQTRTNVTGTATTIGTAAYLSPEQCRDAVADARSDVYALGLVLYEVATGGPPFQITSWAQAVHKHLNEAPTPPRQVRGEISETLEQVILRCLAKNPDDRYATGDELADALAQVIAGPGVVLPTSEPAPSPPPQQTGTSVFLVISRGQRPTLTPGASTLVTLLLSNLRRTVDHLRVTIAGVPAEWVAGNERPLQLNPDEQGEMVLTITPPRTAAATAGEHPVTIRAESQTNPDAAREVVDTWTVQPFFASAVALEPEQASGTGEAIFHVVITNGGNAPVRYQLAGEGSEEAGLSYFFARSEVEVDPGAHARVDLRVSVLPRHGGDIRHLPFAVVARPSLGDTPPPARGRWSEYALPPLPTSDPPPTTQPPRQPPPIYPSAPSGYTQVPVAKKKKRGGLVALFVFMLTALVGGGALLYLNRSRLPFVALATATPSVTTAVAAQPSEPTETPSPTETPALAAVVITPTPVPTTAIPVSTIPVAVAPTFTPIPPTVTPTRTPSPTPLPSLRNANWVDVLTHDPDPKLRIRAEGCESFDGHLLVAYNGEALGCALIGKNILYGDIDGDGIEEAIIDTTAGSLDSTITSLIYRATPNGPRFITTGPGSGRFGLTIANGKLEARAGLYKTSDPSCCPSGGVEVTQYRLQGTQLAKVGSRVEPYKP